MDRWEEEVQFLESLRQEYGSLARGIGLLLACRAALLLTSATLIGTIANMYFSGLSSFKLAKVEPSGDVISILGNTPSLLLAVFIAMLIGLVVTTVFAFDDEFRAIITTLLMRGSQIEDTLGTGQGLFHQLRHLESLLEYGFGIARMVLVVVALGWALFFIFIGAH